MLLNSSLEQRQNILQARNLLVEEQDIGVLHLSGHLLGIGDKVGRDVTAVKLHTLDHINSSVSALGLLDSDDTVFLDLLHGCCDDVTNLLVVVSAHACHVANLLQVITHFLRLCLDAGNDSLDGLVNTALDIHGVGSSGNILQALVDDGLCEHCCCGGAIAGVVVGLGSDLLDELSADVLELVLELHLTSHTHTILGDVWCAILLVQDDIASFRTKGYFDGVA